MQYLLEFVCAVYDRRLVERVVYACDRGQVYDRAPADALPDPRGDVYGPEILGVLQKGNARAAEKFRNIAEQAGGQAKVDDQAAYDHGGNEMWQVGDGLHYALIAIEWHFREQYRKYYRGRETKDQVINADQNGVADQAGKMDAVYKLNDVLEADPLAHEEAAKTNARHILLESHYVAHHGDIGKHHVKHNGRHYHDIQQPVVMKILFYVGAGKFSSRRCHAGPS